MGEVDLIAFINDNYNTHGSKQCVGHTQTLIKHEHICDVNIDNDSRVIDPGIGARQSTRIMSYADAVRGLTS